MKDQQKVKKRRFVLLITFLFLTTFLTLKIFKKVNFQDISIFGSELFSKEDIVANSSLKFPTPLIFVKTKFTEEELKENLSLENVSIFRQILPFGLKIYIKTRTPIAFGEQILNGEKVNGFIDKNGIFIYEKYADKKNIKQLSSKVFGWKENFSKSLSKILNFQESNDVEFVTISFAANGFITLEEKSLKKIFLGSDKKNIEEQLQIVSNIKNELIGNKILEKIDKIDLSDPNNPKIKVFKP